MNNKNTIKITPDYWEIADLQQVKSARNLRILASIAIRILHRMSNINPELGMLCGPLRSGETREYKDNVILLNKTIEKLRSEGKMIFNQMDFGDTLARLYQESKSSNPNEEVMKEFFQPLFQTGKFKEMFFTYDWQTAEGSKKEYRMAEELGLTITILPEDYLLQKNYFQEPVEVSQEEEQP